MWSRFSSHFGSACTGKSCTRLCNRNFHQHKSGRGGHVPPEGQQNCGFFDTTHCTLFLFVFVQHHIFGFTNKRSSGRNGRFMRSEEHTSELQSLMRISYAVFCLQKKK